MRSRILVLIVLALVASPALAALPAGFHRNDPITGRVEPTGVYFAHDGRVFVTEKSGVVWVYAHLPTASDPVQPKVFADVSANVHDYWDRGLLGFALDPRFPEQPYVYVQYAFNGGLFDDLPPRWPPTGCPNPTDPNAGCVISGHLSRLTVGEDGTAGDELVLVEDWYQQYPSHSVGTIAFGPDGWLYAGGGDGASFNFHDLGQSGNPLWPDQRSPAGAGGSLRSQGLEDEAAYTGDIWLDGAIIRIDPATGAGAPGNPLAGGANTPNAQRVVAYGLRNPFRFTFRPGTPGELWLGDVGENTWEEINIIPPLAKTAATLTNFGWPCFEGRGHHDGFNVPICTALYEDGGGRTPATPPWYTYVHQGSSDVTGLAFYEGTSYPEAYRNSLFFADNSRTILFNIPYVDENGDGEPDPPPDGTAHVFYQDTTATAVQLTTGPGGDLFYPNVYSGAISRISYCDGCTNVAPSAAIALDAGSSADGAPRTIAFTAANSVDPDGDALVYDWDLDGDGAFGDASGATTFRFYAEEGSYRVAVRVTDGAGASDTQSMLVTVTGTLGAADVGVSLDDGVAVVSPGDALTYTMIVANHGADAVAGEGVATTLSPLLADAAWNCTPSAGASCAATGTGDIEDSVDLPVGGSVTYTIDANVMSGASGIVESSAAVTPPPGYEDPDPSDNTATDIDTVDGDRIFADGFDGT
jgi:glucose/arabinose dehydrogenase